MTSIEMRINRIEHELKRIKTLYAKSQRYQSSDPESALMNARRFAEAICRQLLLEGVPVEGHQKAFEKMRLDEFIRQLERRQVVPKFVLVQLRIIQLFGNYGSHEQGVQEVSVTAESVKPCMLVLDQLLQWYLRTRHEQEFIPTEHVSDDEDAFLQEGHIVLSEAQRIYETALREALDDMIITPEEKHYLRQLRRQLGLSPEQASELYASIKADYVEIYQSRTRPSPKDIVEAHRVDEPDGSLQSVADLSSTINILQTAQQRFEELTQFLESNEEGLEGQVGSVSGTFKRLSRVVADAMDSVSNMWARRAPRTLSYRVEEASFDMVRFDAGQFNMGTEVPLSDAHMDECHHSVTLSTPFALTVTPVTQKQWAVVMGRSLNEQQATLPVTNVDWIDAIMFCNRLSVMFSLEPCYVVEKSLFRVNTKVRWTGMQGFRLPTEAEWEYACRAGWDGNPHMREQHDSQRLTHNTPLTSVYDFAADNAGLRGMLGNVFEWCWDWYSSKSADMAAFDPRGPEQGEHRVARGGSHQSPLSELRPAYRGYFPPHQPNPQVGLRVVRLSL